MSRTFSMHMKHEISLSVGSYLIYIYIIVSSFIPKYLWGRVYNGETRNEFSSHINH